MHKQRLNQSDYLVIAANLIPVFGVWFQGWSAKEVFIVYALETLIIGVFTVFKLGIATIFKGGDLWYNNGTSSRVSGLFFILFFIIHYGLFATIQTAIFSASADINPPGTGYFYFFLNWYKYINGDVMIMLLGFIASYAAKELFPFVVNEDYRKQSMMRMMFQPYGRIIIQQFIVILGSMFLTFGLDKFFILIFAAVKIFFEVWVNFGNIIDKAMSNMEKQSGK